MFIFFLIYHLSGMLRPPEACIVEEFHLSMLSFQTVTLCLSLSLSVPPSQTRMLPSVTFILVEGFETAECNLIPSPRISGVGNQPGIYCFCTIHSCGWLVVYGRGTSMVQVWSQKARILHFLCASHLHPRLIFVEVRPFTVILKQRQQRFEKLQKRSVLLVIL